MRHKIGGDATAGAIAGVVATVVLGEVTSVLYEEAGRLARWREDWARGGESACEVAAEKIAGLIGADLSGRQEASAGTEIHYGLGFGPGAAYGAGRWLNRRP